MKDLQDIVHELKTRKVTLRATEQPIDTSTAAAIAMAFVTIVILLSILQAGVVRGLARREA